MGRSCAAVAVIVAVALASCSVDVERSSPAGCSVEQVQAACLAEVGFVHVDGLIVEDVDRSRGIDSLTQFTLTGPSQNVDEALRRADFSGAFDQMSATGLQVDASADGGDLIGVAKDRWVSVDGQEIHRQVARFAVVGQPGVEILKVVAFDT